MRNKNNASKQFEQLYQVAGFGFEVKAIFKSLQLTLKVLNFDKEHPVYIDVLISVYDIS